MGFTWFYHGFWIFFDIFGPPNSSGFHFTTCSFDQFAENLREMGWNQCSQSRFLWPKSSRNLATADTADTGALGFVSRIMIFHDFPKSNCHSTGMRTIRRHTHMAYMGFSWIHPTPPRDRDLRCVCTSWVGMTQESCLWARRQVPYEIPLLYIRLYIIHGVSTVTSHVSYDTYNSYGTSKAGHSSQNSHGQVQSHEVDDVIP